MRRTLRIVEDSELNSGLLVQLCEGTYEVELASDGETAAAITGTKRLDVILMDVGLPSVSGLEAVCAIRTTGPGSSIIAVRAGVTPGDRERALDARCDEFVAKPIDDRVITRLVGRLVGSR